MEEGELPLVVDEPSQKLAALFSSGEGRSRAARQLIDLLEGTQSARHPARDGLAGSDASEYLADLIERVTKEVVFRAQGYSSARWLWYLRRLPDVEFSGGHPTTLGYDRNLAECVTWFSAKAEHSATETLFSFRVDDSACRHLLAFVAAIKFLSHLHATYRRVGKGASIHFEHGTPFADQDETTAEAIAIYDERIGAAQPSQAALGVIGPPRNFQMPGANPSDPQLIIFDRCSSMIVPVPVSITGRGRVLANVCARHIFSVVPAESLLMPYADNPDTALPFLRTIEPLILLLTLFPMLAVELSEALGTVLQVGYCVVSARRFERIFTSWLSAVRSILGKLAPSIEWSCSYQDWHSRMMAIEPKLWPMQSGGCIRQTGDVMVVDFSATSSALRSLTVIDRSAFHLSNVRSATFESQIQRLIDGSEWCPSNEIGAMRGRTLRREGKHLTDVDAIGARGSTLLLISCKSLIYDAEYDKGAYRVIANAQTTIDTAVAKWRTLLEEIRISPYGDNFDFSSFHEFIGVVCTPFVVYSKNELTLSEVAPGLRWCIPPHELHDWLYPGVAFRPS